MYSCIIQYISNSSTPVTAPVVSGEGGEFHFIKYSLSNAYTGGTLVVTYPVPTKQPKSKLEVWGVTAVVYGIDGQCLITNHVTYNCKLQAACLSEPNVA